MKRLLLLISLVLSGCLVGNDGFQSEIDSVQVEPPCIPGKCTETPTADKTARQGIPFEFTFTTTNTGSYYYLKNKPPWVAIDSTAKKISGTPTDGGSYSGLKIMVHDMVTTDVIGPFALTALADPLANSAWHLSNSGQTSFSIRAGTSGEDPKIAAAIAKGFTGSGIRIAVSDTGVEIGHEDLTANILAGESRDYSLAFPYTGDPTPTDPDEGHGTAVAGLIAARGWNSIGTRGVAPEAGLAGFYFLGAAITIPKLIHQATGTFDIFNQSWGYPSCSYVPTVSTYLAQIKDQALNGRGGKGALFLKSAGNSFVGDLYECLAIPPGQMPYMGNSGFDGDNTNPYTLIIGAVNAKGERSSYSTPGSNLWISAPGGEYGDDDPAMITTDMEGCSHGLAVSSATANAFEKGQSALNSSCNYTSTMNGTSSAAPVAAGVIALMLEANPALTWRDVKHILASSATVVQSGVGNTTHPFNYGLTGHVYERGWITNTAGFKFHNWFGFGRIHADQAVTMAASYGASLPTLKVTVDKDNETYYLSGALNVAVPDRSATGASTTLNVLHNLVTEAVLIKVSVSHTRPSDLGLELTSPSGTKSYLTNINSFMADTSFTDVVLMSNAFYGESSRGTWTLKVVDGLNGVTGSITNFNLKIFGHVTATPAEAVAPGPPASINVPAMAPTLTTTPTVTWTASPAGDVMRYEFSVGTSSGATDILEWQSAGATLTASETGLSFASGNTYHFNVRAVDTSENLSTSVSGSFTAP